MEKKRERRYTYYIEALPSGDVAYTNKVLSNNIDEEDACQELPCADREKRSMWRCSRIKAISLWSSRHNWESLGFKIRVWEQEGNGQIRVASGKKKNPDFRYGRPNRKKRAKSYAH